MLTIRFQFGAAYGRSVPMNRSAQDRRSSVGERYAAPDEAEPSGKQYWAGNENQRDPEFGHRYDIGNEELSDSSARANPPTASQIAHELNDFGGGHSDKATSRDAAENHRPCTTVTMMNTIERRATIPMIMPTAKTENIAEISMRSGEVD